jgi:uncharacterized protein YraI
VPPTKTPKPTFTPTPDWTPTSLAYPTTAPEVQVTAAPAENTPEAAATAGGEAQATTAPEATAAPTEAPAATVTRFTANQNVNVRSGPGTVYPAIGRLTAGQSFDVAGRNDAGDWIKFDFNGREGWVTFALVSIEGDLGGVQIAQAPAVPTARPQPTARPRPAQPPAPQPQPQPQPQPAAASFPWMLVPGSVKAAGQCGAPYFKGQVQYKDGSPQNGVCLLIDRYGPRQIKYSGSDGAAGNWGFTPCGEENCGQVKIYVIECPPGVDAAGLSVGPGTPISAPQSDVFEVNVTDKCAAGQFENIIFRGTR